MTTTLGVSLLTDEEVKFIDDMAKVEDRSVSYILTRLIRSSLKETLKPIT